MNETTLEIQSVEEYRKSIRQRIRTILEEIDRVEGLRVPHSQPYKMPNSRVILPWNNARHTYLEEVKKLREELRWLQGEIKALHKRRNQEENVEARREAQKRQANHETRTRRKLNREADAQLKGGDGLSDKEWDAIGRDSENNLKRWVEVWASNPSRANYKSALDAAADLLSNPGADASIADEKLEIMLSKSYGILRGAINLFQKDPSKRNARRVIRRAEETAFLGGDINFMIDTLEKASTRLVRPRAHARK